MSTDEYEIHYFTAFGYIICAVTKDGKTSLGRVDSKRGRQKLEEIKEIITAKAIKKYEQEYRLQD